jgi:phospholipase/carboxylesterase
MMLPRLKSLTAWLVLAAVPIAGCDTPAAPADRGSARLTAQHHAPQATIGFGLSRVTLPGAAGPSAWLYVPSSYDPAHPLPLVVAFHGAGIGADGPIDLLDGYAEQYGFLLVSIESTAYTWDVLYGPYGPDLARIDAVLRFVFDHCAVDRDRIVIEGFSDGASYALGVGLANGDLFSRIVAFSPGFIPKTSSPDLGKPAVFLSHGRQDQVLPIDGASRFLAATLQHFGYPVTLVEFDGGHTVPADVLSQAVDWLLRE